MSEGSKPASKPASKPPRRQLSDDFLGALARDFAEFGEEAVRACRLKDPVSYCRVVTAVLPKEVSVTVSELEELDNAELDRRIAEALRAVAVAGGEAEPRGPAGGEAASPRSH